MSSTVKRWFVSANAALLLLILMSCHVKTMELNAVLNNACNGASLRMLKDAGHLNMAQYHDAEHRRCPPNVYAKTSWLYAQNKKWQSLPKALNPLEDILTNSPLRPVGA